jgi:hypothetical protein
LRAKHKRFSGLNAWVVLDGANRYVSCIHRQMLRGMKDNFSALNGRAIT